MAGSPRRVERMTVGAGYLSTFAVQGLRMLVESPPQARGWRTPDDDVSVLAPVGSVVTVVLTTVVLVLVIQRWKAEPEPARPAQRLFWAAVALIALVVAASSMTHLFRVPVRTGEALLFRYALSIMLIGLAVLVGSFRTHVANHQRVSHLLAWLQPRPPEHESLRDALAEALEDPSLTLHLNRADSDEYVDAHGRPAPLPARQDRAITLVTGTQQQPLAALVHDPFLVTEPQHRTRLQVVAAVAGLALESSRLRADNQKHLRGLLSVQHTTRRNIQAMLHDGIQHRLSVIQLLLGQARKQSLGPALDAQLMRIADDLQTTVLDLRELAEGVYPSNLRNKGLRDALDALAQRSPVPLVLDVSADRWPGHVEETVFFLISEAVGNAQKHANATKITVLVRRTTGGLLVEVADDGSGGVVVGAYGTGLRGMQDRVSAHAGTLAIDSPPTHGTTIRAVLPCGS
jgi:signal transduction histidine kinase